jgi:ABC-type methionine transport system ATPase subunit
MPTKTKSATVRQHVHLTFPENLINEPVLSRLAKQFDVDFNIRGSTVTSDLALVALEIDGRDKEVAKAIAWLRARGISVEPMERKTLE